MNNAARPPNPAPAPATSWLCYSSSSHCRVWCRIRLKGTKKGYSLKCHRLSGGGNHKKGGPTHKVGATGLGQGASIILRHLCCGQIRWVRGWANGRRQRRCAWLRRLPSTARRAQDPGRPTVHISNTHKPSAAGLAGLILTKGGKDGWSIHHLRIPFSVRSSRPLHGMVAVPGMLAVAR